MPKTYLPRNKTYASKSLFTDTPETENMGSDSSQTRKSVKGADARNVVGDQGVAKLKREGRGVATPSAKQETPTEMSARKAAQKKAMDDENDELVGKVKKAMSKPGGAGARANYDE